MVRQLLHNNPGVSGEEKFAHDTIIEYLKPLSPTHLYDHVGGYGVVAIWESDPEAKTIAFRADIDALPIGHRCGHDGHTAIMLRFAELVAANPLPHLNTMLIFQPEEETGMGAAKIVQSGLLQNVAAIYGLHNLPGYPLGQVVLNKGTFAAASSGVVYRLQGRETHASTPEKGVNPGLAVSEIIQAMLQLNTNPSDLQHFQQATLICVRLGEEAFGTSAGSADVMFTLRAYTNRQMNLLLDTANNIAKDAAIRHHLELKTSYREPFKATENDPQLVAELGKLAAGFGYDVVMQETPFRWSEDFAEYQLQIPGVLFGIGAGETHAELHHPEYDFPDEIIEPSAQLFAHIRGEQGIK
ncbi:MAG: amidohydrolase [Bacteroidales bacterium]|nr:amidohydrolase [Candidatus Colimorpha pelethequi]